MNFEHIKGYELQIKNKKKNRKRKKILKPDAENKNTEQ